MSTIAKAIVGAAIAGLSSLSQALDDGGVTAQESVAVAIATLIALGAIWRVPNAESQPRDRKGRFAGKE